MRATSCRREECGKLKQNVPEKELACRGGIIRENKIDSRWKSFTQAELGDHVQEYVVILHVPAGFDRN